MDSETRGEFRSASETETGETPTAWAMWRKVTRAPDSRDAAGNELTFGDELIFLRAGMGQFNPVVSAKESFVYRLT